jgi:type III secretion system low calcium response chaperone LcrH/SycD
MPHHSTTPSSFDNSEPLKKVETHLHDFTQATSLADLESIIAKKHAAAGSLLEMLGLSQDSLKKLETEAYTLYNSQKFENAKELFQLLCCTSVTSAEPWVLLGACYMHLKQHKKALDCFGCATLLNPTDPRPFFFAGFSNYELNDLSESRLCFQEVVNLVNTSHQKKDPLYNEMRKQAKHTLAALV